MYSPQLNRTRTIYTFVPPGLIENPLPRETSLAVLHDGQLLLTLAPVLNGLVVAGDVREIVVVGVDSSDPAIPNYRGGILTPSACNPECVCPLASSSWCHAGCDPGDSPSGLGAKYLAFLTDSLLPSVTASLNVTILAHNTASWGYSLGGLTAWYHSYTAPLTFGASIAGSPSLWWNCGEALRDVDKIARTSRVYIDVGSAEGLYMNVPERLAYEELISFGFVDGQSAWLSVARGDFHEFNSFAMKMPRALKAVFPGALGDMSHYEPPNRALPQWDRQAQR